MAWRDAMPDDSLNATDPETTLAVPGVLCVAPGSSGTSVVRLGPSAGWMVPRGIARWEREISFVRRADMGAKLARALHATLPHEQIPPKKLPICYKATEGSPFLPLQRKLVAAAVEQGVRVFTVGVDRVSAGFFVFMEGGGRETVRVQGNLVEMLAPALKQTGGNDLGPLQAGLMDRLLLTLTNGVACELDVELANALPRMSRDGTGLDGTYLEAFEVQARALASRSARWAAPARDLARALTLASRGGETRVTVPLFGEARLEVSPALEVQIAGKTAVLKELRQWVVIGPPNEELAEASRSAPAKRPIPASTPPQAEAKTEPQAQPQAQPYTPEQGAVPADAPESSPPPGPEAPKAAAPQVKRPPGVRAMLVLVVVASLAYAVWDALKG